MIGAYTRKHHLAHRCDWSLDPSRMSGPRPQNLLPLHLISNGANKGRPSNILHEHMSKHRPHRKRALRTSVDSTAGAWHRRRQGRYLNQCSRTATTGSSRTHLRRLYCRHVTYGKPLLKLHDARCQFAPDVPRICATRTSKNKAAPVCAASACPRSQVFGQAAAVWHGIPSRAAHQRTCRRPDV
jgi:hypothetical protein